MATRLDSLPTLRGADFVLRPAQPAELDVFADAISADSEASPWWGTDAETIRRWFASPDYYLFALEQAGDVVGVLGFEEVDDDDYRSAGVDIGLLSCCIGKGLGTAALRLLVGWLIDERGHHRITIDPAANNGRAIRAYEKVGFKRIGIAREYERGSDGVWHDNLLMDLLASEFRRA